MPNEEFQLPPSRNPFTVPEGYFDTLTERIMRQIPEETTTQKVVTLPLWRRYGFRAAAAVIGIIMGLGALALFNQNAILTPQDNATATIETVGTSQQTDAIDQVADYLMCDNHDMYAYLSGE